MSINLLQPHSEYLHRAEPTPQARTIDIFADIVRRDRGSPGDNDGRYKQKACKELAYIYHMCDYESPFFQVPSATRHSEVVEAIFPDDPDWTPDELVQKGLALYKKLSQTPSMRLLESAYNAVDELQTYFTEVQMSGEKNKGKVAKELIASLGKLSAVVDSLNDLKERVNKEKSSSSEQWGGVELNEFNRG